MVKIVKLPPLIISVPYCLVKVNYHVLCHQVPVTCELSLLYGSEIIKHNLCNGKSQNFLQKVFIKRL